MQQYTYNNPIYKYKSYSKYKSVITIQKPKYEYNPIYNYNVIIIGQPPTRGSPNSRHPTRGTQNFCRETAMIDNNQLLLSIN